MTSPMPATDHTVLASDRETLVRFAAYTTAHADKVMAEVHQDIMASIDRKLTSYVPTAVKAAQDERQRVEDTRAIRRNRNRILTLLVVLAMELIVPTLATAHLLPMFFVKYEVLAITAPDALLTMYAYFRRY